MTGATGDGDDDRGEKEDTQGMSYADEEGEEVMNGHEAEEQNRVHDENQDEHDDSTEEDDESVQETRDLPVTLTRVLFLACDACIYCGGKFVG